MTVETSDASGGGLLEKDSEGASATLRQRGARRLREGAFAEAIELFGRASALAPEDSRAGFELGVALQAARRHVEALEHFQRARKSLPNDPAPSVHAAMSSLALGHADSALEAATEACVRAPRLPQAHCACGQALLALGEPKRAEQAFADALRDAPAWADAWVLLGVARGRQGAIEEAKAALRQALRHAPGHAVATANLAVLEREGDARGAKVSAGTEVPTRPSVPEPPSAGDKVALSAWRPKSQAVSLGLAVEFLRNKPAFARLQFGEWSQVLFYQAARGHCFFVVDQQRKVHGFLGWALTNERLAEEWVEGRAGLRNEDCLAGDRVIINAWAADSAGANRILLETARKLFGREHTLYFKRHYPDGRTRPMRLSVNDFVAGHLARLSERASKGDPVANRPAVQ